MHSDNLISIETICLIIITVVAVLAAFGVVPT